MKESRRFRRALNSLVKATYQHLVSPGWLSKKQKKKLKNSKRAHLLCADEGLYQRYAQPGSADKQRDSSTLSTQ